MQLLQRPCLPPGTASLPSSGVSRVCISGPTWRLLSSPLASSLRAQGEGTRSSLLPQTGRVGSGVHQHSSFPKEVVLPSHIRLYPFAPSEASQLTSTTFLQFPNRYSRISPWNGGAFLTSSVDFGSGALAEAETKDGHAPSSVTFVFFVPSPVPGM